jgi:hypothetical protein
LDGLTRNGSFHFFKTAGGIFSTITRGGSKSSNGTKENKEDGSYEEKEEGDVVAVFGEIVEDPTLVEPLDACREPTKVRDEVKR